jgi:hypothetical protein
MFDITIPQGVADIFVISDEKEDGYELCVVVGNHESRVSIKLNKTQFDRLRESASNAHYVLEEYPREKQPKGA